MSTCPTCKRRPSERIEMELHSDEGVADLVLDRCADPIHDRADQCEELTARNDALCMTMEKVRKLIERNSQGDWWEDAAVAIIDAALQAAKEPA